jgi:hypothetical protein
MKRRTMTGVLVTKTEKKDGRIIKREPVVPNDSYAVDDYGSVVRSKGQKLTKGQRMQMRESASRGRR